MAALTPPRRTDALIVGISGPSSSGKTTLARLLQRVFCGVSLLPGEHDNTWNAKPARTQAGRLNTFIIHEDDFYYPDDQIPYTTTPSGTKVQDWDTAAAIDTNFLARSLAYVREHGTLPPRLRSKEDQNEDSGSGVPDSLVMELREGVVRALSSGPGTRNGTEIGHGTPPTTIAFMEGFLLYSPPRTSPPPSASTSPSPSNDAENPLRPVHDQIHLPLFLPASYQNVKSRREGRAGYVTIGPAPEPPETTSTTPTPTPTPNTNTSTNTQPQDDTSNREAPKEINLEEESPVPPQNFWIDPPGYVDEIVWPRYVADHAWLLVADDSAEGDLIEKVGDGTVVKEDVGVRVAPGRGEGGMEGVLRWAVGEVLGVYLGGL